MNIHYYQTIHIDDDDMLFLEYQIINLIFQNKQRSLGELRG